MLFVLPFIVEQVVYLSRSGVRTNRGVYAAAADRVSLCANFNEEFPT